MNKEIKIKKGYGDILFDMPVEEVVAILGEADELEAIQNATDETTTGAPLRRQHHPFL